MYKVFFVCVVTNPLYISVSECKLQFDCKAGLFLSSIILYVAWTNTARKGSIV